jgi:capsular polysaccharide biosynthesis protein
MDFMTGQSLADFINSFDDKDDLPELEAHHLFDKLIQSHGLLSEVVDYLQQDNFDPELQGMIKAAEQLTDFIVIAFQQRMPHD